MFFPGSSSQVNQKHFTQVRSTSLIAETTFAMSTTWVMKSFTHKSQNILQTQGNLISITSQFGKYHEGKCKGEISFWRGESPHQWSRNETKF